MAGEKRTLLRTFMIANNAYINATVTFYVVDPITLQRTSQLANLWQGLTGQNRFTNPLVLDGSGKNLFPVYFDQAISGVITLLGFDDYDTGVIFPAGGLWRGDYVSMEYYYSGDIVRDDATGNLYVAATYFQASTLSADVGAQKLKNEIPVGDVIGSALIASNAANTSVAARDVSIANSASSGVNAVSANNSAISAAASAAAAAGIVVGADFRYGQSAGTSTAYTLDFSPDVVLINGFRVFMEAHVGCGNAPALSVDGSAFYPIMNGLVRNSTGSYKAVTLGEIHAAQQVILIFRSDIGAGAFLAQNLPLKHLAQTLEGNNSGVNAVYRPHDFLVIAQTFTVSDAGRRQVYQGTAVVQWDIGLNATAAIPINSEIEICNDSAFDLTLKAVTGVVFGGIDGGKVVIPPQKSAIITKLATNRWFYAGFDEVTV
jgi:hypothetical protein